MLEDTCIIRPDALTAEFTKPRSEGIVDAAEECPTDVIKFETVTVETSDADVAAESLGHFGVGVDLDAEMVLGVEKLNQ